MSANFRDNHGVLEFVDGIEPSYDAIIEGLMTYQIIGVNPDTGNRIAEALITPKGLSKLARELSAH